MRQTKIIGIVAMTPNRVIGSNNTIPWSIPEDMKFFKETTLLHTVVMGRKTFDSIGKPLPKRRNIVLTRDTEWKQSFVETIHAPEDLHQLNSTSPIYVIGGTEVYKAFLPHMDSLIVSHVHNEYEGDTVFPEYEHLFPCKEVLHTFTDFTVCQYSKA